MNHRKINLKEINKQLEQKSPKEIVEWAFGIAEKPIITTNFRPYEAAILNLVTKVKKDISVIWCDTGYNTRETYLHANELIEKLQLNIDLYVPQETAAYRDVYMGIPSVDDKNHKIFTEQVKLEPFRRAMEKHLPDVWFTNLRKGQTAFRDGINIISIGKDNIIKVCPFYFYSDKALNQYLIENSLPNEFRYFDPTKQLENRECGLHT